MKYKDCNEYADHVEERYPHTFEKCNREVLRELIKGAYIDGRLDGISDLGERIAKIRHES